VKHYDEGSPQLTVVSNVPITPQLLQAAVSLLGSVIVTEPENESGEFGEERLIDLIRKHRHQTLSRIGDLITSSVAEWIDGAEQPDDITVVLARAR
jgi:sigma-B regulation protein RsbU (phosphoserine phosphatase)